MKTYHWYRLDLFYGIDFNEAFAILLVYRRFMENINLFSKNVVYYAVVLSFFGVFNLSLLQLTSNIMKKRLLLSLPFTSNPIHVSHHSTCSHSKLIEYFSRFRIYCPASFWSRNSYYNCCSHWWKWRNYTYEYLCYGWRIDNSDWNVYIDTGYGYSRFSTIVFDIKRLHICSFHFERSSYDEISKNFVCSNEREPNWINVSFERKTSLSNTGIVWWIYIYVVRSYVYIFQ